MPAQRPRASFEPIAPDIDVSALVEQTPNFQFVSRISCDMIDLQGMEAFDRLVLLHVVIGGKPLVIDGYQNRLDPWTFSSKWLQDNHGEKVENARNLSKKEPLPLTIAHYLKNMPKLTDQYFDRPDNYRDKDRQRMYLKDIDCPEVWQDKLKELLPPNLFYLNESAGDIGGPGAADEAISTGGKRKGKGIAGAGDLMSSLPSQMRAENLMCYIGHEGTYTPAHREMCASLGHNIMVETSDIVGEDGKPERPGSSVWFMTETNDRHSVGEYWLSQLGHDIEVENHFAQIAAWKKAPFTTYIVEQKIGDFILIPPMAPHQVWNRGTRTMKVAWNRTTVETLEMAVKEALPNARLVCRDEQYKNKAIIFYTLQKYSGLLAKARDQEQTAPSPQEAASLRTSPKIRQLQKDFKRLFELFKQIMLSEMYAPDNPSERGVTVLPFDSNITCAYCRGNIFNRFLTCSSCDNALNTTEPEPYDVCMECYAMGRSCGCISKMTWVEQFKWKELVYKYDYWRRQYIEIDRGLKANSPLPIAEERAKLTRKTLAQVCQEQLKRRPFVNINQPQEDDGEITDEDEEIEINDDGTVKKKKKRRSEAWLKKHHACHVCKHKHEKWKMAECKCGRWWCYGALFRAHDLMPLEVMQDVSWECPHCQGICAVGNCTKDPRQNPYKPKGTLLGHDTRKVADARSVESLVDFSVSNISWLNETSKEAPSNNDRLLTRQEEAERAKAVDVSHLDPYATDDDLDAHDQNGGISYEADRSVIDPALGGDGIAFIDPSLQEDQGRHYAAPERPSASTLPAVSALLNKDHANGGSQSSEHPGYQPAFVAPSALMYRPDVEEDAEGDRDDAELDGEAHNSSKKRKRTDDLGKTMSSRKKHRSDDALQNVSGATKQYRKEAERKALEEARKKGRFIQVHAALKGKSRIVKLQLGSDTMRNFAREASRRSIAIGGTQGPIKEPGGTVLLTSDIAPPKVDAQPIDAGAKVDKTSKQVRIRVERDEDFEAGRRRRERKEVDPIRPKKPRKQSGVGNYEEVDIASLSGEEEPEALSQLDGALETTGKGEKKRRISAWQARRHEDDEDGLPDELPEDWKDRRANRLNATKQAVDNEQATQSQAIRKPAGKSVPQIRPSLQRNPESASDEEDDDHTIQMGTAAAALRFAEENARAKLAAAALYEEDDEDDESDANESSIVSVSAPTSNGVKGVASLSHTLAAPGSVMARKGPGGRNVKIVSGAGRRQTTGNAVVVGGGTSKSFTAVNDKPVAMSSPMARLL